MNPEETITLRTREQWRLEALMHVRAGEWSQVEAAHARGISTRQVRRLVKASQARGPVAMVHGNRGRAAAHKVADAVRAQYGRNSSRSRARAGRMPASTTRISPRSWPP